MYFQLQVITNEVGTYKLGRVYNMHSSEMESTFSHSTEDLEILDILADSTQDLDIFVSDEFYPEESPRKKMKIR